MALTTLAVVTLALLVVAGVCPWWSNTIHGRTEAEWRKSMREYLNQK